MTSAKRDEEFSAGCCALHAVLTEGHAREHKRLENEHRGLWKEVNGMKTVVGLFSFCLQYLFHVSYLMKSILRIFRIRDRMLTVIIRMEMKHTLFVSGE